MNKKVFTLSAVMAGLLFGAAAHAADTRIGVTIYKYDDNFMSVVRKAIEKDGKSAPDVQLLMNDSQNDQSKQNDQIDVLLAKGVKALAINLVDPAAAGTVIEKARGQNIPVVFFNKEPSRKALDSYDKAYYVGTDSKESGIIQGDLIAKHWKANPNWDLNKDGQIQYVLLKGEPGHPDAEARTTYVIKELNDKGLKTQQLQLDTAMWDTAQAKDKMDAWLSGPNANKIEVVIANNDAMAMGAVEALKAHNKSSIPVFGVDALPEALALVKSGAMAGTVLNDANNQAKATFDLAKNEMQVHNNYSEPWRVTLVDTGLHTMTGGRIKRIRDYIGDETFMLTYGDGVSNVDLDALVAFHKQHGKIATLTGVNIGQRFGVMDVDSDGHIREFREKNDDDGKIVNGGFMVLEPGVFDYIEGDDTVFEKAPLEQLAKDGQLMVYRHDGFWKCMDTQRDKMQLEQMWQEGNAPWKLWK